MPFDKKQNYVIKCIKTNNNVCGFSWGIKSEHLEGHYIQSTTKTGPSLETALIYNELRNYVDWFDDENRKWLADNINWTEYYERIPVEIVVKQTNAT